MQKRYQVFVRSTFKDLEEERREVMQAFLELDCFPTGMEKNRSDQPRPRATRAVMRDHTYS